MLLIKRNLSLINKITPTLYSLRSTFSSSASQNPPPKSLPSSAFSPEKAADISKPIANVTTSSSNTDSVRHFLKHNGFTDAEIHKVISAWPIILDADVDQTMQPNLQSLREMGFSELDLRKLLVRSPQALLLPSAIPRISFLKSFLDGDMKKVTRVLLRNRGLIFRDIDEDATKKMSLLKEYGFSENDIRWLVVGERSLYIRSAAELEVLLKKTRELGLLPGSPMFFDALSALARLGTGRVPVRMEFYKGFGWSEEDFLTAFRKVPSFILLSQGNVEETMEFLVGRAGCTTSYIAAHPEILKYSLRKRLMPRHHVMSTLKLNESVGRERNFTTIIRMSEEKFVDVCIRPYEKEAPRLLEIYKDACAGKVLL